ncbi:hypothetical protein SODALDRAFT_123129 [Sodiomyces alkalinus F11]|uniref:Uncharacterized protein n=1 Tax=Sodiomyces alkalinus (strain CBS 110278 / VKM F-3762 / F11) TaxID=1314773 RepID=A0A3N2Q498_SODAK|nr:hypothetical protein SODALDRAFT_123129 [Sodiomyces alkalinus F11]ROT41582.1 hypothetical protein SODALDRAFT_123129 [Sodiomyces alkalinus F11]
MRISPYRLTKQNRRISGHLEFMSPNPEPPAIRHHLAIMNLETASTLATQNPSCREGRSVSSAILSPPPPPPPPSLVDQIANLPNELKHQVIADALCTQRCVLGVFLPEWDLCTNDPCRRALDELYGLQRIETYRKSDGSRVVLSEHQHVWGDFLLPGATTTPIMMEIRRRWPGAFDVGLVDALRRSSSVFVPPLISPHAHQPTLSTRTNRAVQRHTTLVGGDERGRAVREMDGTLGKLPTFPLRVMVPGYLGTRAVDTTDWDGNDGMAWLEASSSLGDNMETMFLDLRGCATGDVSVSSVVQFARELRGVGVSLRRLVVAGLRTGSRAFAGGVGGRGGLSGTGTAEMEMEGMLSPEGELVLVDQRSVWLDWDFWEQEAAEAGLYPLHSPWSTT